MNKLKPVLGRLPNFQHIDRRGLVLDLPMNEGHGDKIQDYHTPVWGLSNNGVVNGAEWVAGQSGPALRFTDTGDNILVPGLSGNAAIWEGDFTVIAAVNKANDVDGRIFEYRLDGGDFKGLGMVYSASTNKYQCFIDVGASTVNVFTETVSLDTDYIVAMVREGDTLSIYLDGIFQESITGVTVDLRNAASNAYIGNDRNATGNPFGGTISYINISDTALSAQEIKSLFNNPWQAWQRDNIALWVAAQPTGSVNLLDGLFERKRLIA